MLFLDKPRNQLVKLIKITQIMKYALTYISKNVWSVFSNFIPGNRQHWKESEIVYDIL